MDRENNIADKIKSIQKDLSEYRSRQILAGDSLRVYDTYSNDSYDFMTTLSAYQTKNYELIFTPTSARTQTILTMFVFYKPDDPDVMDGIYSGIVSVVGYPRRPIPIREFEFMAYNGDSVSHDVYIKFYFTGTATGTWEINSI